MSLNSGIVDYIWRRDEGKCVYCGASGYEVDHVLPKSRGGPDIKGNLVLACKNCNSDKKAKIVLSLMTRGFYHLLEHHEDLSWIDLADEL